jgi:tetratricopeptide (TPR) repeat protein
MKKNIYSISIFSAVCLAFVLVPCHVFASENPVKKEKASPDQPKISNSIALLKNGKIKEANQITSGITTIDGYSENDKKALFDSFYDGFVKLSKEYRLTEALMLTSEWTRLFPGEKIAALYHASLLSESHRSDEANEKFEAGFKLGEKYRKIDNQLLNYFYYNAAGSLADAEAWEKSNDYVQKIEKTERSFAGLGLVKCRIYYYLGRFDEGLKSCEEALKTDERKAGALEYATYAGYYRRNKNYSKSLEISTKAMSKFPLADGLAMTAAADHIRLGNYYQALMLCIREDMIAQYLYYDNKNMRELKQKIQDDIAGKKTVEAEKAAKVFGFLKMLNDKKYEEAIKVMDELKENTLIYREGIEIFRGEALESLGKYKEAESIYNYVLSRDGTLILGYCKLFELYMKKMNQKEKALEAFTKAKKIKPDHWKVMQIDEWLQKNQ